MARVAPVVSPCRHGSDTFLENLHNPPCGDWASGCCCCCPCAKQAPAFPDRWPFEAWRAMGCLPSGLTPQELGMAFSRAHRGKRQPRFWSQRGARKPCYSAEELLRSIAALTVWGEGE